MKRKHLIIGALGVLALAVILLVTLGGGGDDAAETPVAGLTESPSGPGDTRTTGEDGGAAGPTGAGGVTGAPGARGRRPAEGGAAAPDGSPDVSSTAGGGAPAGGSAGGSAGGQPEGGQPETASSSRGGEGSAAPQGGAQAPRTAEILRATARAYEDVSSLQADFVQRLENTLLGRTVRSSGTLYQRQPAGFRMDFSDPEGDLIVSDGRYFWLYFPSTDQNQVIRTRRGAAGLDLRSQFIGDPVARFDATYHGRESVAGRDAHVLTLVPREPLGYERLKVWIDDRDHLVRRFDLTEANGIVRHFTLSDLRLNPSLPDRLFRFDPPAGARVVDQG